MIDWSLEILEEEQEKAHERWMERHFSDQKEARASWEKEETEWEAS